MKKAETLINLSLPTPNKETSQQQQQNTSERAEAASRWCVDQMSAICPSMMNNELKGEGKAEAYASHLLAAFVENGIDTKEKIKKGLERLRSEPSDFAPAIGKFVSWCKPNPADFGLPSNELAYREACVNAGKQSNVRKWTHLAIYHAAVRTGIMELKSQKPEKTIKLFKENYSQVFQEIADGAILEEPLLLAKPEKAPPTSQAQAMKNIKDIKGLLK